MLDNNLNLMHPSILIFEIDYFLTQKNIAQIIFLQPNPSCFYSLYIKNINKKLFKILHTFNIIQ